MASMREIKHRLGSVGSIRQITKAMKLVATVKLQKARNKAEAGKPYTELMMDAMKNVLSSSSLQHPYLVTRGNGKRLVVLLTSNRGLAGGYNSNAIKKALSTESDPEKVLFVTIGNKGREYLAARNYKIVRDESDIMNEPLYKDAVYLTEKLLQQYEEEEISEIDLVYTEFVNTVTHIPRSVKLLPAGETEETKKAKEILPMNFDADDEETISHLVPQYMASVIYGAFLECIAAENGARMTAMDNATDNADEMLKELSLDYNRARQGSITQELTEIIAGSNAVK